MSNSIKPKLVDTLNLNQLNPISLEFWCLTDEIDKEVMERKGKTYNSDLAFKTLYFVITTDLKISILPDFVFKPWMERNGIKEMEKSDKAKKAIEWFITDVHKINSNDGKSK